MRVSIFTVLATLGCKPVLSSSPFIHEGKTSALLLRRGPEAEDTLPQPYPCSLTARLVRVSVQSPCPQCRMLKIRPPKGLTQVCDSKGDWSACCGFLSWKAKWLPMKKQRGASEALPPLCASCGPQPRSLTAGSGEVTSFCTR